jgi:hypothetical protein
VAVWGADYVERFERYGLSSILAPGNLPQLAETCNVELVLLTRREDFAHFRKLRLMAEVEKHAAVRFADIDDLIGRGPYTVTLTLAFTRGMRLFGDAMTSMHFIYWNADFVMSDGTLSNLAKHIGADRKVVLTGSLRAVAEEAAPLLERWRGPDGILRASGRELVGLTLSYPHALTVAKTLGQDFCYTVVPNQMFWRVDDQTLVGRFFQIFMFCLKPTRVVHTIDGYCDYTFVPELCPGEPLEIIEDSDELFLLELQGRDLELEAVRFGPRPPGPWERSIEEWCSPEHKATTKRPVVFHAGEIPASIEEVIDQSSRFLEDLTCSLKAPVPPAQHYYWVSGVAAFLNNRPAADRMLGPPDELDLRLPLTYLQHPSYRDYRAQRRLVSEGPSQDSGASRLARKCFGTTPNITRMHPEAPGFGPLVRVTKELRASLDHEPKRTLLVVADLGTWVDRALSLDHPRLFRAELDTVAQWTFSEQTLADEAFVYAPLRPTPEQIAGLLRGTASGVKAGGRIQVALHAPLMSGPSSWLDDSLRRAIAAGAPFRLLSYEGYEASTSDTLYARRLAAGRARLAATSPVVKSQAAFAVLRALLEKLAGVEAKGPSLTTVALLTGVAEPVRSWPNSRCVEPQRS